MQFLNPKTDYAFRKIFGSDYSQEILVSFLNAILGLHDANAIVEVRIIDPYLAPVIVGMKNSYLDVRVKDQCGRFYIVEMQVLNVEGFEKRVLYNACKAYVNQLRKGDGYTVLTEVVAVTIVDFVMFPQLTDVVSRFRLRSAEDQMVSIDDLDIVFAELPKFKKSEDELSDTLDRWLYFLTNAGDLTAIPRSLAVEPAIVKALEIANSAAWTREELDKLQQCEFWIDDQRRIREAAQAANEKAREDVLAAQEEVLAAQEARDKAREEALAAQEARDKARQEVLAAQEANEKAKQEVLAAQAARDNAKQEVLAAQEKAKRDVQEAEEKAREELRQAERAARQNAHDEAQANTLLRLLDRRFGAAPPDVVARVRAADGGQLETWIERILDARVLADVFDRLS